MKSLKVLYQNILDEDWDAVDEFCPWFNQLQDIPQDPIWHAEGDVRTHTIMVLDALKSMDAFSHLSESQRQILIISALFHDIEKRSTTTTEIIEGLERIVSPNHSKKGARTTQTVLYKNFDAGFEQRQEIVNLVRYHGLPVWGIEKSDPRKTVIKVSLEVNTELLYLLAKADFMGRISQEKEDCLLRIELFKELCKEHQCWAKPREFHDAFSRWFYLNKDDVAPEYQAYDDTEFEVIMMTGLPGAGKDTYIKNHLNLPVISLDEIRKELGVNPTDKKGNGRVIQIGKERAKEFLRRKEPFVFNSTNITRSIRSNWLDLFHTYKARVKIIYVEVPYQQLLIQNANREDKVPESVIDRLVEKLEVLETIEANKMILFT